MLGPVYTFQSVRHRFRFDLFTLAREAPDLGTELLYVTGDIASGVEYGGEGRTSPR